MRRGDARDRQRARLYAWEDRVVAPRDGTQVRRADAQAMIDALWTDLGLRFPPAVTALPRQARATVADASRLQIRLHEQTPSWCILHELAHALTSTHEDVSDRHGAGFVGVYVRLLERYMGFDGTLILHSLHEAGIAVDPTARIAFVD